MVYFLSFFLHLAFFSFPILSFFFTVQLLFFLSITPLPRSFILSRTLTYCFFLFCFLIFFYFFSSSRFAFFPCFFLSSFLLTYPPFLPSHPSFSLYQFLLVFFLSCFPLPRSNSHHLSSPCHSLLCLIH